MSIKLIKPTIGQYGDTWRVRYGDIRGEGNTVKRAMNAFLRACSLLPSNHFADEEWIDVPEHPAYQVSNRMRVRRGDDYLKNIRYVTVEGRVYLTEFGAECGRQALTLIESTYGVDFGLPNMSLTFGSAKNQPNPKGVLKVGSISDVVRDALRVHSGQMFTYGEISHMTGEVNLDFPLRYLSDRGLITRTKDCKPGKRWQYVYQYKQ